jgi:PhnB protein
MARKPTVTRGEVAPSPGSTSASAAIQLSFYEEEIMAKAIPDGYHVVTPYLTIRNAGAGIEFYKKAFGAEEVMRMAGPDGKIMHAEIRIGGSIVMLGEENMERNAPSPQAVGGSTAGIMLYCENVDQMFDRAVKAGAKAEMPPADMFWGDRFGSLVDPFGHRWSVATHKKDVSPQEMAKASQEFMKQQAQQKK